MFAEPGTAMLVEDPTYAGALSFLKTMPIDLVPVGTDADGIIPDDLERILETWPEHNPNGKKDQPRPKVLYTVPVGGNPTGVSSTLDRKKRMYQVCQKYDIIIIEDDPYYYLQVIITRGEGVLRHPMLTYICSSMSNAHHPTCPWMWMVEYYASIV